ncbi:MAG: AAA family ATPase, partial [Ilumatobacteraceae bacterium]
MPSVFDNNAAVPSSAPPIFGRRNELAALEAAVVSARDGLGTALVLTGGPGIGKSTLLGHAASMIPGAQVRSVVGVEAESAFAFAGLQRLLRRDLDRLGDLSPRHRSVMRVAIGTEPGDPVDAKLVGLALLSLLSDLAGSSGGLVCVDDAQWLDAESLHALGFAARRLHAEGVTILFGIRARAAASTALDGLPTIELEGLDAVDAVQLLRRSIDAPISDEVASRIVDTTGGNPLALIDLGQELTAAELSGATAVPDPIPLGDQLQVHYRQQIDGLTVDTRSWLLAAAAEPSAEVALLAAAARAMGIDPTAADDAEAAGVVVVRTQVRFRHPLVRSAVYGGATPAERRDVHRALASVMLASTDATRRAWHLAAAATDVDDDLADELERCADEARSRGGRETVATLLARAADLTGASFHRAQRLVSAAESAFAAGSLVQARALLDRCAAGDLDHALIGRALALRARVDIRLGAPNAERDAAIRCLEAADAVGGRTIAGRAALLGACEHSVIAARFAGPADARAVADAIERTGRADEPDPRLEGLLGAFTALVGGRWRDAVECVRSATDALDADEIAGMPARDVTIIATSLCSA